jgi:ribulose-phosphate 3-epimerase
MPAVRVLPSLLSADFTALGADLRSCAEAGARILHVDVMDAHFVPNLTMGPFIVAAMRRATALHLDVHLMMTDPLRYVDDFRAAGADALTIHVEAVGPRGMAQAIERVRATGARVGLAFNPDTDPRLWWRFCDRVDLVMFMTVYPGFGGQAFIPEVRDAIRATRARFPQLDIQVDGGIGRETAATVVGDGANRLVCGSAFFGDPDRAGFVRTLEAMA